MRMKKSLRRRINPNWIKKLLNGYRCSTISTLAIYLLLLATTEGPRFTFAKIAKIIVESVQDRLITSSGLDEVIVAIPDSPKPSIEKTKLTILSVISILFLWYLVGEYKRQVFQELPLVEI